MSFGAGDKSLIEFKLGKSTSLKRNLEKQVAIHEKANKTARSAKAIICYTERDQIRVERMLEDLGLTNAEHVVVIDARSDNKPSRRRPRPSELANLTRIWPPLSPRQQRQIGNRTRPLRNLRQTT